MNLIVKNTFRFLLMLLVQVFILNKVPPLHQFIVPYFYFAFLLWLPFKITRMALLFTGFLVGVFVDLFYKTPGLHAAASVMISYFRPYLIDLLMPKEATEWGNEEPSSKTMGPVPYMTYLVMLTLLHNSYLILLEWIQFGSFLYFLGKLVATSLVSLLLIYIIDLFLYRQNFTECLLCFVPNGLGIG